MGLMREVGTTSWVVLCVMVLAVPQGKGEAECSR